MAVEVPALERGLPVIWPEQLRAEHGVVADHVEHDPVAVVVGIQRVEHVTGLDVVPDDVGESPSRGRSPTRA